MDEAHYIKNKKVSMTRLTLAEACRVNKGKMQQLPS